MENPSDDLCLPGFYDPGFPFSPVTIGKGGGAVGPIRHPALIAPLGVLRDAFALLLGDGGEDGGQELSAHLGSVDVLLLEADAYSEALQQPDGFQAVGGVAGKAGDGFAEHLVDEAALAIGNEPLKLSALFGRGAGDPLVGIEVDEGPLLPGGDVGGVIPHLGHEGVQLVGGIGTDPGIGCYPQFLRAELLVRLDDDDPGLLLGQAALHHRLFSHRSHLLSAIQHTTTFPQ